MMQCQCRVHIVYMHGKFAITVASPVTREKMIEQHIDQDAGETPVRGFKQASRGDHLGMRVGEYIDLAMGYDAAAYGVGKSGKRGAATHEVATELTGHGSRIAMREQRVSEEIHTAHREALCFGA